eukprot:g756.t1
MVHNLDNQIILLLLSSCSSGAGPGEATSHRRELAEKAVSSVAGSRYLPPDFLNITMILQFKPVNSPGRTWWILEHYKIDSKYWLRTWILTQEVVGILDARIGCSQAVPYCLRRHHISRRHLMVSQSSSLAAYYQFKQRLSATRICRLCLKWSIAWPMRESPFCVGNVSFSMRKGAQASYILHLVCIGLVTIAADLEWSSSYFSRYCYQFKQRLNAKYASENSF